MKNFSDHPQSIWLESTQGRVGIIDQTRLPHEVVPVSLSSSEDVIRSIADMWVRGAPLIGVTAAYGVWLACLECSGSDWKSQLQTRAALIRQTRPTAVNLAWAVDQQLKKLSGVSSSQEAEALLLEGARSIEKEDVESCASIGRHGLKEIRRLVKEKKGPLNILTHCNAGRLACVEWGTATSPIYHAHEAGIDLHVWVDETRPRNQGASLTAWELGEWGVPHTVIADNAGGHLMQNGDVDLVITGADRVTKNGDVANKIGTYLKALAAADNRLPFWVAMPSSTIDWTLDDGMAQIPIEDRSADEVRMIRGQTEEGELTEVLLVPKNTAARNPGFDVTPARLVTAFLTERGFCTREQGLFSLYPEEHNG